MLTLLAKAQSNKGMAYIRAVWGNELWNTLVLASPSSQWHTDVFQKQTLSKLPLSTRNKNNNNKKKHKVQERALQGDLSIHDCESKLN